VSAEDSETLVSVDELALRWRTPSSAVAQLVADGVIPSLDGGLLARRGRLDVPVLRPSWAERARVDSPGASRRLDVGLEKGLHPAATAAVELHAALADRDAGGVWSLSSTASKEQAGAPPRLLEHWIAAMGDVFSRDTGVATGVYALVPHRGVGVRIVGEVGPLPIRYDRATPQSAIGMFVFVPESDTWRADLPLTAADIDYLELTRTAPPAGWTASDGALP